eukprot:TRINITY_DN25736_c0_g1_i1.p1 TRINITY_DN25736_c0_g1~~TRINITY_DN25736_c0_g1_i1.p1  ORF type:complete len:1535 (+),score=436.25 TRINITY_DN25736_c0_g1_i1:43-4647(+)
MGCGCGRAAKADAESPAPVAPPAERNAAYRDDSSESEPDRMADADVARGMQLLSSAMDPGRHRASPSHQGLDAPGTTSGSGSTHSPGILLDANIALTAHIPQVAEQFFESPMSPGGDDSESEQSEPIADSPPRPPPVKPELAFPSSPPTAAKLATAPPDGDLDSLKMTNTPLPEAGLANTKLGKAKFRGMDLSGASMEAAQLALSDVRYSNFSNADARRCNLKGSDLRGTDWSGAQLVGAGLRETLLTDEAHRCPPRGLNLTLNDFSHCRLDFANLAGVDLSGARLKEVSLRSADLHAAKLTKAVLLSANLSDADIRGADFTGAQMYHTNIKGATLTDEKCPMPPAGLLINGVDLTGIVCRSGWLMNADLSGVQMGRGKTTLAKADFTGACMHSADMSETDLSGANLSEADLRNAHAVEAVMKKAVLVGADLSGASFASADMTGADLRGTMLRGTILPALRQCVLTDETFRSLPTGLLLSARDLSSCRLDYAALRERAIVDAKMPGASLRNSRLPRANLTGTNLSKAKITDAFLRRAVMVRARLTAADLGGSNFSRADLTEADISDTFCGGTSFYAAVLCGSNFSEAKVAGAVFHRAKLTSSRHPQPPAGLDLAAYDLAGVGLQFADLHKRKLTGAHLRGAHLQRADLQEAECAGADFSESNWLQAEATRANLRRTNLAAACLNSAVLQKADLRGAKLMKLISVDLTSVGPDALADIGVSVHPEQRRGGTATVLEKPDDRDSDAPVDWVVDSVAEGSVAAQMQVHAGDRLYTIDGTHVVSLSSLAATLNSVPEGASVCFAVKDSEASARDTNFNGVHLTDRRERIPAPGLQLHVHDLADANLHSAHLPGAWLAWARLERANLHDANLRGAVLVGANLAGANLAGADLTDADLSLADMRDCTLDSHTRMPGCRLLGANMTGATCGNPCLTDTVLTDKRHPQMPKGLQLAGKDVSGASMCFARLRGHEAGGAVLRGCLLEEANMMDMHLVGASLMKCDLSTAKLTGADLRGCNVEHTVLPALRGVQLTSESHPDLPRGLTLREKDLRAASLTHARLSGHDCTRVTLSRGEMADADLRGACFDNADLVACDLRDANVEGASFVKADMRGSDLTGVDVTGDPGPLRYAILTSADRRAPPSGLMLAGADATGAVLDYADLDSGYPAGFEASDSVLVDVVMRYAVLNRADFSFADLTNADLTGATTDDADLRGTILDGAKLPTTVCRGCMMTDAEHRELPDGITWAGQDLQGCSFDFADAAGRNFKGADLTKASFVRADLTGACFDGATLCGCDMTSATLIDVSMRAADIRGANLTQSVFCIADLPPDERPPDWQSLEREQLQGKVLQEVIVTNKHHPEPPIGLRFSDRDLSDAVVQHASMRGHSFVRAILRRTMFCSADLSGCDFQDSDMTGADLRGSTMTRSNLDGATLKGVELTDGKHPVPPITISGRSLNDCSLRGADLRGADLTKASLRRAKMYRADLRRADLRGSDMSYAFLSDARGCEEARWDGCTLVGASLPETFENAMRQQWGERGWTDRW